MSVAQFDAFLAILDNFCELGVQGSIYSALCCETKWMNLTIAILDFGVRLYGKNRTWSEFFYDRWIFRRQCVNVIDITWVLGWNFRTRCAIHPGGCCTLVVDEETPPSQYRARWVLRKSRKALYKCNKLLLLLLLLLQWPLLSLVWCDITVRSNIVGTALSFSFNLSENPVELCLLCKRIRGKMKWTKDQVLTDAVWNFI